LCCAAENCDCGFSSSSSTTGSGGTAAGAFDVMSFNVLAKEDELELTYDEFVEKRTNEFYVDNPNIFDGKTDAEKEEIILELVGNGDLFVDLAIEIVSREELNLNE
jgi:hypothetical protein